ncbi:hypothetical protein [Paenibacillus contaminans]|uniref:Uncharacterized protein n=1 Tax=Paenibacillus contaminans TaxID=450362 RepID=A0A329MQ94_9BACL|nr:hypothetical protein [Paenibacillus contaminans]RAV22099.1 hypothetical protein DQG23_08685 [Paenibacillus contaminans]
MITMLLTIAFLVAGIPRSNDRQHDGRIMPVYIVLSAVGFGLSIAYWLGYFPKMADSIVSTLRIFHQFYEDGE